ncbi:uncharacterized protein LOC126989214 [Eriocheir sinensis]|uniref:uncharacterized protein LOC126989214 n=1 Tax=Eriocheir sinensis TaxID=95602 RepID=UPI0021C65D3C|nr:uncharacterized protein LOC126989214 [Eriocheir sinensis]
MHFHLSVLQCRRLSPCSVYPRTLAGRSPGDKLPALHTTLCPPPRATLQHTTAPALYLRTFTSAPPPRTMNAPAAAQPASLPKLLIPATVGFETTLDLAEALEQQLGDASPQVPSTTPCSRCYNCQQFGHHRARCSRPRSAAYALPVTTRAVPVKVKYWPDHHQQMPELPGRTPCLESGLRQQARAGRQTAHCPTALGRHSSPCSSRHIPLGRPAAPASRLLQQDKTSHQPSLTPHHLHYEESFPPLTPRHLSPPPPAQLPAPPEPNASRQSRPLTTATPTAAPPGCLLITREMMVGLLEGFRADYRNALKSDVEPSVLGRSAAGGGQSLPDTPAQQAAVPPVQAPSPAGHHQPHLRRPLVL